MDAGTVYLIAGAVTFAFTTVLTVAGVGAAFILIPVFLSLGIGLHTAMATALLLNALAMFFACLRFVPALVGLGFDPKKASATTAFIVIFSSLTGFLGKASIGGMDGRLLAWTAAGSIAGSLLGAWLMQKKLAAGQVKKTIGIILYVIAGHMAWKLAGG